MDNASQDKVQKGRKPLGGIDGVVIKEKAFQKISEAPRETIRGKNQNDPFVPDARERSQEVP